MKDIIKLTKNESDLIEGILKDIDNLQQLIGFCCSNNNPFKDNIDNNNFKLLLQSRDEKIAQKELVIQAFLYKYNTNNRKFYSLNFYNKEMILYDK